MNAGVVGSLWAQCCLDVGRLPVFNADVAGQGVWHIRLSMVAEFSKTLCNLVRNEKLHFGVCLLAQCRERSFGAQSVAATEGTT